MCVGAGGVYSLIDSLCIRRVCTYVMYSAIKHKGSLPFVMAWVGREDITLSGVSQRETNSV